MADHRWSLLCLSHSEIREGVTGIAWDSLQHGDTLDHRQHDVYHTVGQRPTHSIACYQTPRSSGRCPVASVHVINGAMPSGGCEKATSVSTSHFSGLGTSTRMS